ncbi:MAG: branched-chain amino acid ABC transporter permease [Clostridia bacterium]|nr:branched-chain amino acid ABC transporter permease [Clostridia bacterium]MBR2389107.1 branched-chain amino acid ABC transporter permease [Clostridia bacterium]
MKFLIALINGLSAGGTYAIIALGYTMVYGIAKMLNFAHGDVIMAGGYMMFVTLTLLGHPLWAVAAAVVFCVVLGIVIERFAYRPLRGASPLAVLITAIGVSSLLQSLAQILFGSATKMPVKLQISGAFKIGSFDIAYSTLITLAVTVVVMAVLTLFVNYSKTGRAMIAVSEDRDAALLMGINTNAIITITFAIGSALAAIAGYLMLCKAPSLSTTLGAMPGIKAFTAAVIGGIGSIPGAMVGGILLGVIESLSYSVPALAPYTDAVEFAILIIVLLVKPSGILGKMRREKV